MFIEFAIGLFNQDPDRIIQADEVAGIDFAQHAPLPEQIVVPEGAAPLDDREHGLLMANFDHETDTKMSKDGATFLLFPGPRFRFVCQTLSLHCC